MHRALADVTDPSSIPIAAPGILRRLQRVPTRRSQRRLERSAGRAQARGGLAAAAAFLDRAAELTLDPVLRTQRALDAAQAKFEAAAPDAAAKLLATAEMGPLDELQRARVERLRAQIAFARTGAADVPGSRSRPELRPCC